MVGKKSLKRTLSTNETQKLSSKKREMSKDMKILIGYEELYTSEKIYEDMTILLIDKFIEYQKFSGSVPSNQKVTLITPFNKEKNYLESHLQVN